MSGDTTTVGLVQIGEMIWERRPSKQFQLVDGALRPKPMNADNFAASLAYLPLSVSLLQAFSTAYPPDGASLEYLTPLYRRLPLDEAIAHLAPADVVGFSVYVWNVGYSLKLAGELKRQRPDVLIVLGGPQVPDRPEAFLRANPFVDVVCHGEGEQVFPEILARRSERDWRGVASTSFLDGRGDFVTTARRPRLMDLDVIPSPMLTGVYESWMRTIEDQAWLGLWETNRGCPFSCAFCDWGSATGGKVARYGDERLHAEIEWLADHGVQHLFVCDANFGILKRDVELAERLADAYARRGLPAAISVQNTKNRTERSEDIQRAFKRSRVVSFGASISLQSVDPNVLRAIRRENISLEAFDRLQKHYANEGLDTYTDLIVGLPGETYDTFTRGIETIIRGGQLNRIAVYEAFVLPNAPMAAPEYREEFGLDTVPIRIARAHEQVGGPEDQDPEYIEMVASTSAMSRDEWVRARVFAYLTEMLFYDRVLHVPLCILGVGLGVSFRSLLEAFIDADPQRFPVTASAVSALKTHARRMLAGGPQYTPAPEWLNLWWPPDQFALIGLARGEQLDAFYEEAQAILLAASQLEQEALVADAVQLNAAAFALPFQLLDELVETSYPVGDDYLAIVQGREPSLELRRSVYRVRREHMIWMSWDDWCEDLVRRVFLRKYYLNPIESLSPDDPDVRDELLRDAVPSTAGAV